MLFLTFPKECCLNRSATPTWFVYSVGGWIRTTVLTFKVIVSILRLFSWGICGRSSRDAVHVIPHG